MDSELFADPVIAAYKRDVDRSLLRANLRLTPAQRLEKMMSALRMVAQIKGIARRKPETLPA